MVFIIHVVPVANLVLSGNCENSGAGHKTSRPRRQWWWKLRVPFETKCLGARHFHQQSKQTAVAATNAKSMRKPHSLTHSRIRRKNRAHRLLRQNKAGGRYFPPARQTDKPTDRARLAKLNCSIVSKLIRRVASKIITLELLPKIINWKSASAAANWRYKTFYDLCPALSTLSVCNQTFRQIETSKVRFSGNSQPRFEQENKFSLQKSCSLKLHKDFKKHFPLEKLASAAALCDKHKTLSLTQSI